ncbi:MAG: hypothetical protein M3O30_16310 [Planctomycetota bacterium]|nr:hypothetical protein [Planctomycetota bacterium]
MRRALNFIMGLTVFLVMLSAAAFATGDAASPLAARKARWQSSLEKSEFQFSEGEANLPYRLSQFQGDCQIEMIYDPAKWLGLTFKLLRGGKEIATIEGTMDTALCGTKGAIYFAQPSLGGCGCHVTAFDSVTGNKIWEHELEAVGLVPHSVYSNRVIMRQLVDTKEGNSLCIIGRESFGDYEEVLDEASGMQLAHKIYRQGF